MVFNGDLRMIYSLVNVQKTMEAMARRNRWFTVLKKGWIFPWQTVSHNQRVFRANVSPFEAPPFPPKNHGSTTTTTDLRLDGSSAHQAIDDLRAVLVPWGESFHQQK